MKKRTGAALLCGMGIFLSGCASSQEAPITSEFDRVTICKSLGELAGALGDDSTPPVDVTISPDNTITVNGIPAARIHNIADDIQLALATDAIISSQNENLVQAVSLAAQSAILAANARDDLPHRTPATISGIAVATNSNPAYVNADNRLKIARYNAHLAQEECP